MAVFPTLALVLFALWGLSDGVKVNHQKDYLWKYVHEADRKLGGLTFDEYNSSFAASPTVLSCYYEINSPPIEKVDAFMCTHLLFIGSFSTAPHGMFIFPNQSDVNKVMSLKKINPALKILLTLICHNEHMSEMVLSENLSRRAAESVTSFLMANNFDGFDIDWEYPVWSKDAKETDKNGLTELLKLLRTNFDAQPRKLLLTMATAAPWTICEKAYDIPSLNKYLDYVNIMNYDFHDFSWMEPFTGFNAPLFPKRLEVWLLSRINTAYATLYWANEGMDRSKILCGIPTYGHGFTLLTSYLHGVYAPAVGYSKFGDYINYRMICEEQRGGIGGYTLEWDDEAKVPYMHKDRQWLGYEDERSVSLKAQWIREQGFAGAMVFDLSSDDWNGSCSSNHFPLIKAVNRALFH